MASEPSPAPHQPLRADAARNRETVLAAATRAFAASDTEPSMREIARQAGVGVATLFRHFPTREALVDAVYQDQVVRLTAGASELLDDHPPAQALRRWMDLFAEWQATKHGMTDTLLAMIDVGEIPLAHTRQELLSAITTILDAGATAGDIRTDARPRTSPPASSACSPSPPSPENLPRPSACSTCSWTASDRAEVRRALRRPPPQVIHVPVGPRPTHR